MSGEFSRLACLASSALSLLLGRVMPHRLDAMLAKRWFILALTSSLSVKSASRDLKFEELFIVLYLATAVFFYHMLTFISYYEGKF